MYIEEILPSVADESSCKSLFSFPRNMSRREYDARSARDQFFRGGGFGDDDFFSSAFQGFGMGGMGMSDPFARMDRMMSSMFGRDPFGDSFFSEHRHPMLEDGMRRGRQQHRQPGGALVEEPDDFGHHGHHGHHGHRHGGGHVASYSSYSSSVSSGGPVYYSETKTVSRGPGGVEETHHTVRDGRTGREGITVSRRLGDREHKIERVRQGDGSEVQNTSYMNMREDEEEDFNRQWQQAADRSMPRLHGRHRDDRRDRRMLEDHSHEDIRPLNSTSHSGPIVEELEDED